MIDFEDENLPRELAFEVMNTNDDDMGLSFDEEEIEIEDDVVFPSDYEPCGTCGYDHEYDLVSPKARDESNKSHIRAGDHEFEGNASSFLDSDIESLLKEVAEEDEFGLN